MTLNPKLEVNAKTFSLNRTILNYKCVPKCENNFIEIFNRCYQNRSQFHIHTNAGFISKLSQDLISTWKEIFLTCGLAAIFSVSLLILFQYAIEFIIFFVYFGFILTILIIDILFWVFLAVGDMNYFVPALLMSFLVIILIMIFVWYRKRLKLVAQIFKEASKALIDITSIIFEPILTFIALMIVIVMFVALNLLIHTAGNAIDTKNLDGSIHVAFKGDAGIVIAQIVNYVAFIWFTQLIFDCQHFVIAGTICSWYFTRNKEKLNSPVLKSFYHLIRFHLGSVCFGSMIITIVKVIRIIVQSLLNQKERGSSFLACCCGSILETIENILKYLIRNVYIVVAKDGTPFIESGRKAFKLIWNNLRDVIALNQFGDLVLLISQLLVVGISSLIAYFLVVRLLIYIL